MARLILESLFIAKVCVINDIFRSSFPHHLRAKNIQSKCTFFCIFDTSRFSNCGKNRFSIERINIHCGEKSLIFRVIFRSILGSIFGAFQTEFYDEQMLFLPRISSRKVRKCLSQILYFCSWNNFYRQCYDKNRKRGFLFSFACILMTRKCRYLRYLWCRKQLL